MRRLVGREADKAIVNNGCWLCVLSSQGMVPRAVTYSKEGRKEMFNLTMHSTHFIYGYMASDIWLRTILIVRKETRCRHMVYSFRLTARVLLYPSSHRQDDTYNGICYTSPMGPPRQIDPTTHRTMSERSYHGATSRSLFALAPTHNNNPQTTTKQTNKQTNKKIPKKGTPEASQRFITITYCDSVNNYSIQDD